MMRSYILNNLECIMNNAGDNKIFLHASADEESSTFLTSSLSAFARATPRHLRGVTHKKSMPRLR